jgi:K(+)-stimulated pyrophosphate-energized sodium pump
MESNRIGARRSRLLAVLAAVGGLALLPTQALASEGENVVLSFDNPGKITVWIAFAIGLITLLYGLLYLKPFVMRQSPGSEKMQGVGLAIKEGAVAYLKSQIKTMIPIIVVLSIGLVGLYWRLGNTVAFGVGICFVLGVLASYTSGTVGMLVAVEGNMRTANAALTGYKKALIVAFRSGAVSGMVTVGIGLMGASAIVGLFPSIATNLLVGFAFGASLAALFMRVGGGIFTKAADVGADLVGKVEQGIPEDDPRNPATIADNVGDNVGDCAGMAADVFESYEVTLIAAIVLGAATSAIFDAATWPRLIVFGLAVSAIGLVASAIGIQLVTAKDDPEADPLKSLKRGFYITVCTTIAGVLALSFTTMKGIQTSRLRSPMAMLQEDVKLLNDIRKDVAVKTNKKPSEVPIADVLRDPRAATTGFKAGKDEDEKIAAAVIGFGSRPSQPISNLAGYSKVDFSKPNQPYLDYAVQKAGDPSEPAPMGPAYQTIREAAGGTGDDVIVAGHVHTQATIPPQPSAAPGMPPQKEQSIDDDKYYGPMRKGDLTKYVDAQRTRLKQADPKASVEVVETFPVALYASPDGHMAYGIEANVPHAYIMQPMVQTSYDKLSPTEAAAAAANPDPAKTPAEKGSIEVGLVEHAPVPWWNFALCIAFGILLALAIEYITDYFVSTNKKPTQEVAGVATAGAAPMVIQGFAHALTSSVYMALAVCVGLMFPLFLFNPVVYGGYTLSFYGIALVGIGILTTTGFVLAMDTFGPISDNAQGVFEMSGLGETEPAGAHIVARLDAAGNTTKALTKGFAIATAVIAAVALFHSFLEGAKLSEVGLRLDVPEIFVGLLIGAAAPFLFSAFAIDAVGRASFDLIAEVRRQFKENPGIMEGTVKPDYARCVALVTKAAQKELLAPGVLAIALPIAVGFGFSIGKPSVMIGENSYVLTGAQALGGFLAGAIASGQLMAVLLANSGGMWDNAKKLIEDGLHGGKGTDAHKAAVVGDTIGDPFKDTAGPALNPLIKVMNLVAVLISAVIIQPMSIAITAGVTVVCLVLLVGSIMRAKSGSMSSALQEATAGVAKAESIMAHAPMNAPAPVIAPTTEKKKLFVEDDEETS